MEDDNSTVVIDIDSLQKTLQHNLDHNCTSFCTFDAETNTPSTICRVRNLLHDVYKGDYEPVAVSIGPYYHGNQHLKDVEKVKWKSLGYILKANPDISLQEYVEEIWKLYPGARSSYAEDIKIEDHKFVQMLLLDGCFIVASICGLEGNLSYPNSVPGENIGKEVEALEYSLITRDFLLRENQIPFCIVKRIHELFSSKEGANVLLAEKLANFFEQIFPENSKPVRELERPRVIYHLLHLCHIYLKPSSGRDSCDQRLDFTNPEPSQWHQAIEYHVAGVKFQKRDLDKNIPHSLLDVSFSNDVLQIPYIFIDEITTTIFRNLIVLEQENPHFGNDIGAYICFISQLVGTTEDVTMLVDTGIIEHHFESEEEVLSTLKSLGECVVFEFSGNYYLKTVCLNLETYYRSRMKWSVGWLRQAKSAIQVLV